MPTNPELELVWDGGSLDLLGENDTPYGPVQFSTVAEGTEWGNPQSVRRALFSLLADGSASVTDRHDNRTVVVKLRLSAGDAAALAGGEAPLHMLTTRRRAELRWTPPNDFAAPAAFIVVASDLAHEMDDLGENRVERFYTLTLACLPWARSLNAQTIEALPPFVAAPTVLDDCTSTAGWSGLGDASFAVGGGGVEISGSGGNATITLSKTLARSKRYLALEVENIWGHLTAFTTGDGSHPLIRPWGTSGPLPTPPLVGREGNWYFFDLPASYGSVTGFDISVYMTGSKAVRVLTIAESDTPALSIGRQSLRVIPTPGSARADGSLLVESRDAAADGTGTALGKVLVYTGKEYDPRLSPWRTDTPTPDSNSLSGQAVMIADGETFYFKRPASTFLDGSHAVWVHASRTLNDVPTTWHVKAFISGAASGANMRTLVDTTVITAGTAVDGYELLNLGVIDLPGFDSGAASMLNVHFEVTCTGITFVSLGEMLLFNRSSGTLTVVDTTAVASVTGAAGALTSTTGATRLWLDAATLEGDARVIAGRPSRALSLPVSLSSELLSWDGLHLFTPDATYLYVGTTGVADPKVAGTFRPAWHSHPAE